jgi:hypothetical protein
MSGFNFKQRYGEPNINVGFPHQVAFRIAETGLTELMDNFCTVSAMPHRKRRDMRGHLRYCFANPALADTFATMFGGARIDVATRAAPDARVKVRR